MYQKRWTKPCFSLHETGRVNGPCRLARSIIQRRVVRMLIGTKPAFVKLVHLFRLWRLRKSATAIVIFLSDSLSCGRFKTLVSRYLWAGQCGSVVSNPALRSSPCDTASFF